ncbi:Nramp family divalent metal transporter [Georgenia alba]|uniref:Nramp family divalent metal transporter n=1 Tax=Georgenia alba TaxID=2233858 RepID=A0ABW2Q7H3_9MICO
MTVAIPAERDPYALAPEDVKEPPRGWRASLRYLGPGLVTSASIVGSGELIVTTTLGAQVGFVLLWLVVVATLVKVALQVELARWTITTGRTAVTGFNTISGRIGSLAWPNVILAILAVAKVLQSGAVVGGVALAMSFLLPIGSPDSVGSTTFWVAVVVVSTVVLLYSNRYRRLEKLAIGMVVVFSVLTVLIAVGLPFTDFGYTADDVLRGMEFAVPPGALGAAVAMFALTGVAAEEMTLYTYWCIEKGYARWTGPDDGSPEWAARARGWIGVMQKDAMVSWVVYTFSTLAFYLMGAAVLHSQNIVPEGDSEMIDALSRLYSDTLGEWATAIFLIGAVAVLLSTLWVGVAAWGHIMTDLMSNARLIDWTDRASRETWFKVFTVALPVAWGASYLFIRLPVVMVQITGIVSGCFLLATMVAIWMLRRSTPRHLRGGAAFTVALVVSSLAIALIGAYTIASAFGLEL